MAEATPIPVPVSLPSATSSPPSGTASAVSDAAGSANANTASERFHQVRAWTETLCEPLNTEDYVVQSMPDTSPTKWHLAHTSWFFETFLLAANVSGYHADPTYAFLFNSYYNSLGKQHARPQRGLLSRPTVAQVNAYREQVDADMIELLSGDELPPSLLNLLEIGLNHEQQHQELMLTDLKHMFSCNPLRPTYRPAPLTAAATAVEMVWHPFAEGLQQIGHRGSGFAFDNEGPRHQTFAAAFKIASRPVTCEEFSAFIADGGYQRPELWLSDGWSTVQEQGWRAPLYWFEEDETWQQQTLSGCRGVNSREPVCHVSLFEADAYARWAGARLPTETEWEVAADHWIGPNGRGEDSPEANLAEGGFYHPRPLAPRARHRQMLGDVWEWTRSAYSPYPGFQPPSGALGEYNAKFMNNQNVLRGGSCATPRSHIRSTYRNFFPAATRWQFTGFRLARDGGAA